MRAAAKTVTLGYGAVKAVSAVKNSGVVKNLSKAVLENKAVQNAVKAIKGNSIVQKTVQKASELAVKAGNVINVLTEKYENSAAGRFEKILTNNAGKLLNKTSAYMDKGFSYIAGKTKTALGTTVSKNCDGNKSGSKTIHNDILDSPRTGSALKVDDVNPIYKINEKTGKPQIVKEFPATAQSHGFNDIVDNYAGYATKTPLNNATLYQLDGSLNGLAGRFEWIIQDGNVTHRMFIQNGTMNGVPIKP